MLLTFTKNAPVLLIFFRSVYSSFRRLPLGLSLAGLLLPVFPGPASAETYSVQVGLYQEIKNAENQFAVMRKDRPALPLDFLRIEKHGDRFAVRVGTCGDRTEALRLLSRLTPAYPQAFIWKGDWEKKNILRLLDTQGPTRPRDPPGVSPEGESLPPTKKTGQQDPDGPRAAEPAGSPGNDKVDQSTAKAGPRPAEVSLKANRAVLVGTILDVVSLRPIQPGFSPAKEWLRLVIQVEATTEVNGYPNYLQGKEGEPLTFFTDIRSPLFVLGNKMKALIEYRGDKNSRFFWIIKPGPLSP